jgi:hypothetical protein
MAYDLPKRVMGTVESYHGSLGFLYIHVFSPWAIVTSS